MSIAQGMLVGGEHDECATVADAPRILQQCIDIARTVPGPLQRQVERMLELGEPPLNGTRVMLAASPNTSDTSSERRRLNAANMRNALAATS